MAYDYNKVKEQYEKLTDAQKQSFAKDTSGQVQDFLKQYNAEKNQTSTPTSKTTTTTTTTNNTVAKPEYQGTGSSNVKQSSYTNQGAGNYTYNPTSGYYEKQGGTTTSINQSVADKWNSMSYDEQQEKLKANPNLQNNLTKLGLTNKTAETPTTTGTTTGTTPEKTTTGTTPSGQWDYQDDSPERMAQIAQNLEGYKQTMPYLFNDKKAFDDFFINGVNRSQAQIDFLNDWFYKNQKYSKYDGLTPDSIGYGIAYGDIPEDYLSMLKTTDPAKYQAALQAKQDAEDKIKNKANLGTISDEAGISEGRGSKITDWLKEQGLFVDDDGNLIDDRTENYASEEEQGYLKQIADINARNLDIDNTVKHTYEDYVKKYPGATKATLMAMAQDTNADLLREKENNLVELTRLQGYVSYMQSERQEKDKVGENAINQLQKQYGMYYQYTPEGMSELAQAQYAATNITLDQAENGTDTQKQMALEQTLTPIFEKYGSIIQRSMPQVINDVMKLAEDKGISLSDALEQNFLSYLRQKPEYKTISSGGSLTADKWAKLNDNTLYNVTTGEIMSTDGGSTSYTTNGGATITPISAAANQEATNNLRNKYPIGSSYKTGECGELMNLDAANAGSNIHFGSYLSDKTKWINRETYEGPQVGDYVVFDWTNKPGANEDMKKYGHVGKIVDVKDGSIYIRNQNGTVSGKISVDKYPLKDYEQYIAGYVDPTKTEDYGYWGSPLDDQFAAIQNASSKLNKDQKEALDFADSAYMMMYKLANSGDLDYFLKSPDGQKVLSNYATAQFSNNANYTEDQILNTLKNNVTDQRILGIVNDLMTIIEKKLRWTSGAAIAGSEWNSNSKMLIPQAGENYNTQFRKFQTFEGEYLKKPFDAMGRYAGVNVNYIPLFDGKSPYYTKYVVSAEQEADDVF